MNSTTYSQFPPLTVFSSIDKTREENISKPKKLFIDFVVEYLRNSCKRRSDRYRLMYMNTLTHIVEYCKVKNINELYTNDIDMEFCENFIHYLQSEKNQMQNTVKGNLERVHAMLHKAALYGYPVNNTYEEVHIEEEEVTSVYFSMTEITRMYYFKGLTRFQKEVLDHFILGCLTGLRYSDYSRLNESNFIKDINQISIKTKKTGIIVTIPMHRFVREILKKYNYNLPKPRCIAYFNKAIKEICKKIGFNEMILWERTVGTKVVSEMRPKWQMVSSHTARRSFGTNMFLQKDIPTYRIMMITGHRSEKSFFKYIRVTREENAFALAGHPFFQ
jgi:integrase